MFVFLTLLICFQGEDYANKAYKLMVQASSTLNKNDVYYKNHQGITTIRSQAIEIAKKNCYDAKEIRKMAKSNDVTQKVAAAYACGMGLLSTIDNTLYDLIIDDNNVVSMAARETFVLIANKKLNNFIVDQGPPPNATKIEKYEASVLWKLYMSHFDLSYEDYSKEEMNALNFHFDRLEKNKKENKKKVLKQLEPIEMPEDESNDPTPSDLVDPSAYTVKAITRKSVLQIMNR